MSNILKIIAFLAMLFFTPIGGFFFSFLNTEPAGFHDNIGIGTQSGTGFYVNDNIVISSDRAIAGCKQISIIGSQNKQTKASVLKIDINKGISILKTDTTVAPSIIFYNNNYPDQLKTKLHDFTSEPGTFHTKGVRLSQMLANKFIETTGHSFNHSNSGAPITDERGVLVAMAHSFTTEQAILHFLGKKKTDLSIGGRLILEILDLNKIPHYKHTNTPQMNQYINNPAYKNNVAVNIICF